MVCEEMCFESAVIFLVFDIESHASEINKLVKGNDVSLNIL